MKKLLILFGLILGITLTAQVPGNPDANGTITPGPPFTATGITTGGGEMTLQLDYLNDRGDSITDFIDPADSTAIFTTVDIDSAVITVLDYDPPHGAMSFADSTAVIPLTQNVWSMITNGNNDLFTVQDEDDVALSGDSITIMTDGDYIITWSLSFSGGPSDIFQIVIYKNAIIESVKMERKTSNNDVGNMGLPAYVENLVAGDDLSFYIRNTGDNDDATVTNSSIVVWMIHPD